MKGIIANYRQGRHTQHTNQFIIKIEGVKTKEDAKKYIGYKVKWTSAGGKVIHGVLTHTHGNSGALRARFEKGLPGQAIGQQVEIVEKGEQ